MQDLPGATPGSLRGSSNRFPYIGWLVALIWGGIEVGTFSSGVAPASGVSPLVAWGVVGLFTLPGLFFFWYSVGASLRFFRYRGIELLLDRLPARTGATVTGTLEVPVPYDAENAFLVRISATETQWPRSGSRTVVEYVRFKEEVQAQATPGSHGTLLRFALRIPDSAPPSDDYGETISWNHETRDRIYLRWTIEISADVPGVDLKEEFEIPVRKASAAELGRINEVGGINRMV